MDNHSCRDCVELSLRVLIVCLLLLEAFKRRKEWMLAFLASVFHRVLPLIIRLLLLGGRVALLSHFLPNLLIVALQLKHCARMLPGS